MIFSFLRALFRPVIKNNGIILRFILLKIKYFPEKTYRIKTVSKSIRFLTPKNEYFKKMTYAMSSSTTSSRCSSTSGFSSTRRNSRMERA